MRRLALLLPLLMLIAGPAMAQTTSRDVADVVIDAVTRKAIEDFFGKEAATAVDEDEDEADDDDRGKDRKWKHKKGKGQKGKGRGKGLPPGLAKRGGNLPPGLAKREQLPPGLARRALPEELEGRLPPPPPGTERVVVDDDVVLIDKATETVLDVLMDVVTGRPTGDVRRTD